MKHMISNRARDIEASPTLALSAKAQEMTKSGINVINFGVGEPDFATPEYIKAAAKKALDDNFTRYTPTAGIMDLRQAICHKLATENNLQYEPGQILVSPGAKASLINIMLTILNPRDEVFIPTPYWVSYITQVELADGKPVFLYTDPSTGFKITPQQLRQAILAHPNSKAIILNSPANPTGAVYTEPELRAIVEVCLEHNLYIISDEIYEKLIYDGLKHVSPASLSPEAYEHTIVINGVSKAYAMTGWRLGYSAGPREIISYACRIQDHSTSCVNSIAQKAAVAALREDDGSIERMRVAFEERRNVLCELLTGVDNISCFKPSGAFYVMPDVSDYLAYNKQGLKTTDELSLYLLEKYHIALVAGSSFGVDRYMRFSYATSMDNIREGVRRFKEGLYSLLTR